MGNYTKHVKGSSAGINSKPLVDGQLLYDVEAKRIILDTTVDGNLTRITMAEGTFNGTQSEWDALTDAQKSAFTYVNITNDYEPGIPVMTGATADEDGKSGLVPIPHAGDENKLFKGDGTWTSDVSDTIGDLANLTTSSKATVVDAINEVNAKPSDKTAVYFTIEGRTAEMHVD